MLDILSGVPIIFLKKVNDTFSKINFVGHQFQLIVVVRESGKIGLEQDHSPTTTAKQNLIAQAIRDVVKHSWNRKRIL